LCILFYFEFEMAKKVTTSQPVVGVIGGSGVYDLEGLSNTRWESISSPFGQPSDDMLFGDLDGAQMVFLPRHGRGHRIPPGNINYRANIDAMKRAGVTEIISVSACGSFEEKLSPGTFVIVDQFIDRTTDRKKSFFETGLVAHVSMAHPVCSRLGDNLEEAAIRESIRVHRGGTYLAMEGPQFSSLAESELYRSWGCQVIGMTNMPEAKLAREAEICYATVAMVTDYDCWHPEHENVDVSTVVEVLMNNSENARRLVRSIAPKLSTRNGSCAAGCHHALENALITSPDARDQKQVEKLKAIVGRVL
jgi:5'-methylthioadenosine phosphorylase